MKMYVSNINPSEKRVYIEGIRHKRNGDTYESKVYNISMDKQYYTEKVKDMKLKFPIIFDLGFEKGKGWYFIEKEV